MFVFCRQFLDLYGIVLQEACCVTYHPIQLAKWLDVFWTVIRREVLINVNSDELEHAALDALTALSNAFTTDEQLNSPDFTRVLKSIMAGNA